MTAADDLLGMLDEAPMLVYVNAETGDSGVPYGVYWGKVDVDEFQKVIQVPLPYIVLHTSPGYTRDERPGGQVGGRVMRFRLEGVGESEKQAERVLAEASDVWERKRLNGKLIFRTEGALEYAREDEYAGPGGESLFCGIDVYEVAI